MESFFHTIGIAMNLINARMTQETVSEQEEAGAYTDMLCLLAPIGSVLGALPLFQFV